MKTIIGIRREDKNQWERRVALTPEQIHQLRQQNDIEFICQPFATRAFSDREYRDAGATIAEDLSAASIILGIKEIPEPLLLPDKAYLFFSHTVKGQAYNMPMLQRLLALRATLIDYELIKDRNGRRLVFFGRFAGLAGMVDTLHAFGVRLQKQGIATPFAQIRMSYAYRDIADAKQHIREVGREISATGLPASLSPVVVGFTGYGHVSKGAQEVFDLLPHQEIEPQDLPDIAKEHDKILYKVVFAERDMVEPVAPGAVFELSDYFDHPGKYRSQFERHLPHLSVLVNGIYWDQRYPRLVTKTYLKKRWSENNPLRLQVIGDISCDIHGSIECTEKATASDEPCFTYHPLSGAVVDGIEAEGIVLMAVDNLPAEIPRDSSVAFGQTLAPFIPALAQAELRRPFAELALPPEIKNAIICHQGELVPDYAYLQQHLTSSQGETV